LLLPLLPELLQGLLLLAARVLARLLLLLRLR
jgi:hypothetical protein